MKEDKLSENYKQFLKYEKKIFLHELSLQPILQLFFPNSWDLGMFWGKLHRRSILCDKKCSWKIKILENLLTMASVTSQRD